MRQCLSDHAYVLRNVEMLPTQPMFYIQTLLFAIVVVAGVLYAEGISDSVINVPSVVTLSFEYLVLRAVTALKCVSCRGASVATPPAHTGLCGVGIRRYGYLSPAAYAQWTGRHREGTLVPKPVPDIKRVREGMLAWMTAEKDHIDSEIKETATRLGIDLHACAFSIAAAHPSESHSTMSPAHLQAAKKTLVRWEYFTALPVAAPRLTVVGIGGARSGQCRMWLPTSCLKPAADDTSRRGCSPFRSFSPSRTPCSRPAWAMRWCTTRLKVTSPTVPPLP